MSPGACACAVVVSAESSPPTSKIMQYIKGKSSRKLLMEFKHLQKAYWGQHCRPAATAVASSGNVMADEVIQEYIRQQEGTEPDDGGDNFRVTNRERRTLVRGHDFFLNLPASAGSSSGQRRSIGRLNRPHGAWSAVPAFDRATGAIQSSTGNRPHGGRSSLHTAWRRHSANLKRRVWHSTEAEFRVLLAAFVGLLIVGAPSTSCQCRSGAASTF